MTQNNNKRQKWIDKILEAVKHYGISPSELSRAKFDKFLYSKASARAALEFLSWEDCLTQAGIQHGVEVPANTLKLKTKPNTLYTSPFKFDFEKNKELTQPSSFIPAKKFKIKVKAGDEFFFLPDIHYPFVQQDALLETLNECMKLAKRCIERKVTLHIVQLGDLYDLYSFSRFEKSHHINPKQEIDVARDMAEKMWDYLPHGEFVKRYQLVGNHDIRSQKYIASKMPELKDFLPSTIELMSFKNVMSANMEKDVFVFESETDKFAAMHGYLSKSDAHIFKFKCSVVHGHLHGMGLAFRTLDSGLCFALNCGLLGDSKTYPLAYSSTAESKDWVLGYGRIRVSKTGKFIPSLHPSEGNNEDV